ncbi:hypothetical protein CANDROIZ_440005 [Candidatus Roizmanbacteria bacterium]|nr:hypothetical protein CANDROIZ_440005 [Candidatus Roizmanbacteria bacterium]
MKETGFKGINIVPYNTMRFKTQNGILCMITDLCSTVENLRRI